MSCFTFFTFYISKKKQKKKVHIFSAVFSILSYFCMQFDTQNISLAMEAIAQHPAPTSFSAKPIREVLCMTTSAPLMTWWEMINSSPLCMKAFQQLCWISLMLGGTLCAMLCSLTHQLFWEEWEMCLESWMAQLSGHMHVQCTFADLLGVEHNGRMKNNGTVQTAGTSDSISNWCRPTMQHVNRIKLLVSELNITVRAQLHENRDDWYNY